MSQIASNGLTEKEQQHIKTKDPKQTERLLTERYLDQFMPDNQSSRAVVEMISETTFKNERKAIIDVWNFAKHVQFEKIDTDFLELLILAFRKLRLFKHLVTLHRVVVLKCFKVFESRGLLDISEHVNFELQFLEQLNFLLYLGEFKAYSAKIIQNLETLHSQLKRDCEEDFEQYLSDLIRSEFNYLIDLRFLFSTLQRSPLPVSPDLLRSIFRVNFKISMFVLRKEKSRRFEYPNLDYRFLKKYTSFQESFDFLSKSVYMGSD